MKQSALLLTFLLLVGFVKATNFYFSSSQGNDSRSSLEAQNEATPWKSLDKLNSFFINLNPGDSILFKRGEVFSGAIIITKSGTTGSPIIIGAYGSGADPVISGLTNLSGWHSSGGGIWETACSACDPDINLVLINGEAKEVGRYPNKNDSDQEYLTLDAHSGTSQITSSQLSSNPDWTGGEVVIRKNHWIIDKNLITKHLGNTITYKSDPDSYEPKDHFGFFIQRHPSTLDTEGEWYFDKVAKTMKVYFGSGNPSGFDVKASIVNTLVSLKNQNNIAFTNLVFTGANLNGFQISDAQNIRIENCSVTFSGTNGISASSTTTLSIKNSRVENTYNNAMVLGANCTNTQVTGNKVTNTALFPGMGKSGDESYQGIIIRGSGNVVANNEIVNTGYVPIRFDGNTIEIRNNFINNFNLTKDDGGGIYTYKDSENMPAASNRKITGNIILNGKAATRGAEPSEDLLSHGIYLDDNSDNVEVTGNTVAFCGTGIFAHNANNVIIKDNTLYDNGSQMLMVHDDKSINNPIRNLNVTGNILFAKTATQLTNHIQSIKDDIQQFGNFEGNYYCRPVADNFNIYTSVEENDNTISQTYNLGGWQGAFSKDLTSKKEKITVPYYTLTGLNGTNKFNNSAFNSAITGVTNYSEEGNCKTVWGSGKLDGGSLAVSFVNKQEGNISQVIVRVPAITSGKKYLLRFSLLGTNTNRKLKVFLRNSFAPYNQISDAQYAVINNSRSENEVLLSSTSSVSDGCVVFELEDANGAVWFDNVELYDANVTMTNPDDYIRFEYNASAQTKTVPLSSPYLDVKGGLYTGKIVLQPYSSAVLIRQSEILLPSKELSFTANATDAGTELKWVAPNDNLKFFEAQRSSDGVDFTSLGRIDFMNSPDYKYIDQKPLSDKNFYRLKLVEKNENFSYSKTVLIKNLHQTNAVISPNPVNDFLQVRLQDQKADQKANLTIQNTAGATLKNTPVELADQVIHVDVSSLSAGFYIVSIVSDNLRINKGFIKN